MADISNLLYRLMSSFLPWKGLPFHRRTVRTDLLLVVPWLGFLMIWVSQLLSSYYQHRILNYTGEVNCGVRNTVWANKPVHYQCRFKGMGFGLQHISLFTQYLYCIQGSYAGSNSQVSHMYTINRLTDAEQACCPEDKKHGIPDTRGNLGAWATVIPKANVWMSYSKTKQTVEKSASNQFSLYSS